SLGSNTSDMRFCVFFFSSRRRHTRFKCDWSSDVCSSDLPLSLPLSLSPSLPLSLPHSPSPFLCLSLALSLHITQTASIFLSIPTFPLSVFASFFLHVQSFHPSLPASSSLFLYVCVCVCVCVCVFVCVYVCV